MFAGRIFGTVELPPKHYQQWNIPNGIIYGCPLCYQLNNPHGQLYDDQNNPIEIELYIQPDHRPRVNIKWLTELDAPVSIGVSMGHIYATYIEPNNFDGYEQLEVYPSSQLSILNIDLAPGELIYHNGTLFNRGAILVNVGAEIALVGLGHMNDRLRRSLGNQNLYTMERERFIYDLDTYITIDTTTNDSEYGYYAIKLIVSNSNLLNTTIPITRLNTYNAYGVMYRGQLNREKLIYKYLLLVPDHNAFMLEKKNLEMINRNLDSKPNLPYPYTYQATKCGKFNLSKQSYPTCPSIEQGDGNVGVFIQEYIDSYDTVFDAIGKAPGMDKINILIETIAVIAEAHHGDTVKHHFMHLDPHGENFLLSNCSDKTCSLNIERTVNLGGIEYKFNTHGFKVYMIDFGQSYFIDNGPMDMGDCDYEGRFDGTIIPAIDLIIFAKNVFPEYTTSILREGGEVWNSYKNILRITAMVLVKNTVEFFTKIKGTLTEPIGVDSVDPGDTNSVIDYIVSYHDQPIEQQQHAILKLTNYLFSAMEGVGSANIPELINVIIGIYVDTGTYFSKIVDGEIHRLGSSVCKELGIRQPPEDVIGLGLYLYYLSELGII